MIIELYIALEVVFLIAFFLAFVRGGTLLWLIVIVFGAMLSISGFNIQENSVVVTNQTSIINGSNTFTSYDYDYMEKQNVSFPLVFFNLGAVLLSLVLFFYELFTEVLQTTKKNKKIKLKI